MVVQSKIIYFQTENIATPFDKTTTETVTHTSTVELSQRIPPKKLQMSINKCLLDIGYYATDIGDCIHNINLYINNYKYEVMSLDAYISMFPGTRTESLDITDSIKTIIENCLSENNYQQFPSISIETISSVTCTDLESTSSDDPYINYTLQIDYEYEDNIIFLRPSADISIEHSPETDAYLQINDIISDGSTTEISHMGRKTTTNLLTGAKISTFQLDGDLPTDINYRIVSATLSYDCDVHIDLNLIVTKHSLLIDSIECETFYDCSNPYNDEIKEDYANNGYADAESSFSDSIPSSYTDFPPLRNYNCTSIIDTINNYIETNKEMPSISYKLETNGCVYSDNNKNGTTDISFYNLSQVYLALEYEIIEPTDMGIHYKSNGVYLPVTQAFHKQNGSWIEISAEECREILQT